MLCLRAPARAFMPSRKLTFTDRYFRHDRVPRGVERVLQQQDHVESCSTTSRRDFGSSVVSSGSKDLVAATCGNISLYA